MADPTLTADVEPYLVTTTPAQPTPIPQIVAALRTITPLDGLTDAEYEWLATHGKERRGENDALVFREGEPAHAMNFILAGEIHVRRHHSGPAMLFIGRAGQMTGKLPFSRMKGYGGDGYSIGAAWVLDIDESRFPAMLQAIPSMAQRVVSVLLDRVREVTRMEQQADKIASLGKLAANLAHELNNPASAAQRSAASLFTELRQYGTQKYLLGRAAPSDEALAQYRAWVDRTRKRIAAYDKASDTISPLALSDREETITRWLNARAIAQPWTIAPALAETDVAPAQLDELAAICTPELLPIALSGFASSLRVERMADTVVDSTIRIFDFISAIKDYSYMDQAPIQEVDIAQSLDTTLSMFSARLNGVEVRKNYDPNLPVIRAYGSELNQVWTELIENAFDAMLTTEPPRVLSIATRLEGTLATVEIRNTGPVIDTAVLSRIFEPFFSTKGSHAGLGLGLDNAQRIVSKHSGMISVTSKPGDTCFQVRLPLDRVQAY